jgi:HAD superfamily hydrolase (TIGR01509 family)
MNFPYIISDMDGVLLDTMRMWFDLGPMYVRSLDREPLPDLQEKIFNLSIREGAKMLRQDYALTLSEEEIMAGITAMADSFYTEKAPLKSGVAETLAQLCARGCKCYVATASATSLAKAAFVRTGIDQYLTDIFCCTEMKLEKTDPHFFSVLANTLCTTPENMVLLEDNLHNIEAAKSVGVHTIALYDEPSDNYWPALQQTADFAFREFSQILTVIK